MSDAARFFFDYLSPYAYLAWHDVRGGLEGRAVEPTPVLLAGLLDHHGSVGPAEIPAKRAYVFVDCVRKAAHRGLPLAPPPSHPFNPLLPLRVSSSAVVQDRAALVTRLFDVTWGGAPSPGGFIDEPEAMRALLTDLGEDADAVLADATSVEGKGRLKAQTDDAIAAGVFGVPTLLVDGLVFWGTDGVGHARDRARGQDPAAGLDLSRWASLPATARRAR